MRKGDGYLSVWAQQHAGFVAGELALGGIAGRVEPGKGLHRFLYAWHSGKEELRVVLAGATPMLEAGELLRIYPEGEVGALRLKRARFNDGRIVGRAVEETSAGVMPSRLALHPNHPNPFNPETTIRFELPNLAVMSLEIFALPGQRLRTLVSRELPAGVHRVVWDGRDGRGEPAGSGVYFYRLKVGAASLTRRMLLLK